MISIKNKTTDSHGQDFQSKCKTKQIVRWETMKMHRLSMQNPWNVRFAHQKALTIQDVQWKFKEK